MYTLRLIILGCPLPLQSAPVGNKVRNWDGLHSCSSFPGGGQCVAFQITYAVKYWGLHLLCILLPSPYFRLVRDESYLVTHSRERRQCGVKAGAVGVGDIGVDAIERGAWVSRLLSSIFHGRWAWEASS